MSMVIGWHSWYATAYMHVKRFWGSRNGFCQFLPPLLYTPELTERRR
jgi:hypothetical protein